MKTTKAKGQSNKFVRIITIPVRALCKARDFYVKSMTGYANKVGGTGFMASDGRMMPRSFSTTAATRADDGDDFRELIRAASARSYGHGRNELDAYLKELIAQQQQAAASKVSASASASGLPKNKSVRTAGAGMGMGMMIIEEGEEDKEGSSRAGIRS